MAAEMGLDRILCVRWHASAAVLAAALALSVTACGGSSSHAASSSAASSSTASSSAASPSTSTSTSTSASGASGDVAAGEHVFVSAGCGSCHTLAAAHTSGTVGPDLDQLKPSEAAVVSQVTNGGPGMPSFSGRLTTTQIQAVAKFVASATH
jgi:mono/diheme cytochrome c family protein